MWLRTTTKATWGTMFLREVIVKPLITPRNVQTNPGSEAGAWIAQTGDSGGGGRAFGHAAANERTSVPIIAQRRPSATLMPQITPLNCLECQSSRPVLVLYARMTVWER